MRALFFSETGRVACKCDRQLAFCRHCIDKFSYHRVLACTDKIQVFAFDFIHHCVHLRKAHDSRDDIGANHKRRHAIGKALFNHKIARISKNCTVQSCNVAHEIVKSLSSDSAGGFFVNSVKKSHYISVIRNFKICLCLFAELLHFNVFTVVTSYRYGRIDDIGQRHHDFFNLRAQLSLFFFCICQFFGLFSHKLFHFQRFFCFSLTHKRTDLL